MANLTPRHNSVLTHWCTLVHILPEDHREHRNEVGSISAAECIMGFEPGTF